MANVIIGIHGLGNKPPKNTLELWWKQSMLEGLRKNGLSSNLPNFKLVYWADLMYEKPLSESENDTDSPYYLHEKYCQSKKTPVVENHDARRKLLDFLGRQLNKILLNEDYSLNYSFITDRIVNRYFRDLELYYKDDCMQDNISLCKTRDHIRNRLVEVLKKYEGDNIMLIGHSMGSIIAFDVLTFFSPQIHVNTFITIGSPLGLPVVISKIASEQKQRFNGENHMVTPSGVLSKWYNFSDILDKVAFNFRLADDFGENGQGVSPVDIEVVNDYEIDGVRNPHKSYGYLRTPEFAKILDEFIRMEKLKFGQKIIRKVSTTLNSIQANLKRQKERIIN